MTSESQCVLFMDRFDGTGAEAQAWIADVDKMNVPVTPTLVSYAGPGFPTYSARSTEQSLDASVDSLLEHIPTAPCTLTLVGASLGTVVCLLAYELIRALDNVALTKVVLVVPATDPDPRIVTPFKRESGRSGTDYPRVLHDLFDVGSPYLPRANQAITALALAGVEIHAIYSPLDTYCRFDGDRTKGTLPDAHRANFHSHALKTPVLPSSPADRKSAMDQHLWFRKCPETLHLVADVLAGRPVNP